MRFIGNGVERKPCVQVTFRPLKLQQYSDHIEIFCNNSSFIVLVEAYTPATHIEVCSNEGNGKFYPFLSLLSFNSYSDNDIRNII